MNSLELDITHYSNSELKEIFNLNNFATKNEIEFTINNYKENVKNEININPVKKKSLIFFLDKALENLLGDIKDKHKKTKNHPDESMLGTFSQPFNSIIETQDNQVIIKDQNRIAGLKAKLFEGRVVDSGEYPPGYINPINIKTIKQAVNIDTRFRPQYFNTTSTDFVITLPEKFTKVVKMRLASLEIPTSIYAISEFRDNTTFSVDAVFNPLATWGYGMHCLDYLDCKTLNTPCWDPSANWGKGSENLENNPWAKAQFDMFNSFWKSINNNSNLTIELATPIFANTSCLDYQGWPKSNNGQNAYLNFAFDTSTNQVANIADWINCYAQNFTSRNNTNVKRQITNFFSDGHYRYLRPGLIEDLNYIYKYNPNTPYPSDLSSFDSYNTIEKQTEYIKNIIKDNISTLYSDNPHPFFFFPWRINNLTVKLPAGNYSSKSNKKPHAGCIEDIINSELYNVGLDPKYTICYTINPIDGKSIFSRPSSIPNYTIPDASLNSIIHGNCSCQDIIDCSCHDISCCSIPLSSTKKKWITVNSALIPLQPNNDISGSIPHVSNNPKRGDWKLGYADYCTKAGVPLISSFNIKFNVSTDGTPDVEQPLPLKLGWQLGFRAGSYGLCEVALSEGICLITGPRYIYFCINDFTNASNNYFRAAFAESILSPHILGRINYSKLQQDAGVFGLAEDDDYNNSLNRTREYFGPTEIQRLHFQIIDEYGRIVRFNNMDWSCAIMFDVLYD